MVQILNKVQVNIPFTLLYESHLSQVLEYGLNPEIGFDADALDRFSFSDLEGVAKQIHERGLCVTLHAPYLDLSPGSLDSAVRALTRHRLQQVCQLVPIFRPKTVVCHTGYDHKRYLGVKETWIQNSIEVWAWLSERIQTEGAVLVLENVFEQSPSEFLEVYEKLKDRHVGFCLDTGHLAVFSLASLSQWLEALGENITQLHLHDNLGNQDDHLALGKGNIEFQRLFKYLRNRRMDPPIITLEPHREEDLWPSLQYLENIWPW